MKRCPSHVVALTSLAEQSLNDPEERDESQAGSVLAFGGRHTLDNTQCLCRKCNKAKGISVIAHTGVQLSTVFRLETAPQLHTYVVKKWPIGRTEWQA